MKRKTRNTTNTPEPSDISPAKQNKVVTHKVYYLAVLIAFFTFALYLPALQNEFLIGWDDGLYITDNLYIRSFNWKFFCWAFSDTSVALYWHPLTWISHALDFALWEANQLGHHLSSIVIHAMNAGVVFLLTITLLEYVNRDASNNKGTVVFDQRELLTVCSVTGLLFGIHPVHVESVAWVAMRKDLLYSFFYMLSILSYIHYVSDITTKVTQRAFYLNGRYYTSLLLFILAICSKPMAVTLPAVLMLLDWYPLNRIGTRKNPVTSILEKLPFVVISCIISYVSTFAQNSGEGLKTFVDVTFYARVLVMFRALSMYLWNIIVPANLQPLYPYPKDISITRPEYLLAIFLIVILTAGCVILTNKNRLPLTVWGFFIISLLPVIGFFQTGGQFMADRYVYLACVGPFLFIGISFNWIWTKFNSLGQKGRVLKQLLAVTAILFAVFLSSITFKQIGLWENAIVLWSSYIEKEGRHFPDVYFTRGEEFRRKGQLDQAMEDYNTAISINPKYGAAYINRGIIFMERGQYDRAIEDFTTLMALEPNSVDSHINLGNAFYKKGETDRALREYDTAIFKKPGYYTTYVNRGIVYKENGKIIKAIEDFSVALSLKPDLTSLYLVRGDLYMKNGTIDLAMRDYQKACNLGSDTGCKKQLFPFAR